MRLNNKFISEKNLTSNLQMLDLIIQFYERINISLIACCFINKLLLFYIMFKLFVF